MLMPAARVANPRRVRPRYARSFAASRNQGVRFGISERIGLATQLRGRDNGPSDRLAQGPAFRPQGVSARSSSRPGGPTMKRVERKIALRCAVYTRVYDRGRGLRTPAFCGLRVDAVERGEVVGLAEVSGPFLRSDVIINILARHAIPDRPSRD